MRQINIEVEGQIISYYESQGSGHPILMLHGNSMSGRCYAKQFISPLCEQYRLVAPDLPGHGNSPAAVSPESTYTLPGYAALVTRFAKQLGIEDALMVGWSLGGHILLEAADCMPDYAGMLLFGTPPVGKPIASDPFLNHPAVPLFFKNHLTSEDVQDMAAASVCPGSQAPPDVVEQIKASDGRGRELLGASIAAGNYTDEIAVVAGLAVPVAVIHGEQDQLVNGDYFKSLRMPTLWRSEVQVIADAGHAPHWEQPEQFNRLLSEFAESCLK